MRMSLSLQLKPNSGHCGDFAAATMISARCGSIVDNPEVPTFRPESEHLRRQQQAQSLRLLAVFVVQDDGSWEGTVMRV